MMLVYLVAGPANRVFPSSKVLVNHHDFYVKMLEFPLWLA